ncbi:MAG: phosphoribosyltransferase family protein [Campylobacterota bacterium]|nr:phosphoribosyltransferase family protein [Campylobacterota bacterium]
MQEINKVYYGYDEFVVDTKILLKQIQSYNPEALIPVARGGMALGQLLGEAMDTREVYCINSIHYEGTVKLDTCKIFNVPNLSRVSKVVIIDDIIDSGESMVDILKKLKRLYPHCEFKVATIFYKPTALIQPDFTVKEAHDWIDFFWEVDLLDKN